MASVVSASLTGDQNIDGLLYTTKWSGTVTYAFPTLLPTYYQSADVPGFTQVSFEQRQAVRGILGGSSALPVAPSYNSVTALTNLSVVENYNGTTPFDDASDIEIFQADTIFGSNIGTARVVDFPQVGQSSYSLGGDVVFDSVDSGGSARNPIMGDYYYHQHMHELGHALGLKHGHDQSYGSLTKLSSGFDAMEYTVMTYRAYQNGPITGYTNEQYGFAQTFMSLDILALQTLYGADYTTNSGTSVYSWSPTTGQMSINGVVATTPGANRVFLTIWDGGGSDWYDMSNYTNAVSIDLRPGGYSNTSSTQLANLGGGNYAHGNVYNSFLYQGNTASLIENAKGGSGADTIVGNEAANLVFAYGGNDSLVGGAGSDTFYGGAGSDTIAYVYDTGSQGIYVNLASNVAIDTFGAVDYLYEIENIYGTSLGYPGGYWSDFLIGDNYNNVIYGFGGNDYLSGGYGYDYLNGGTGTDWFALTAEIQGGVYDVILDFNAGGVTDYLVLSTAYQSLTSFGNGSGYAYAYINFGSSAYTVIAYGTTAAQLQAQTFFN